MFDADEPIIQLDADNPYPRQAYVTLVTTLDYVVGAEVLAKSLRHTGTQRQILAMVGELVPEEGVYALEDAGLITTRVPSVPSNPSVRLTIVPIR